MRLSKYSIPTRKEIPNEEPQSFEGLKFKEKKVSLKRKYTLKPKYKYRAGSEFDVFLEENRNFSPLKVSYYLRKEEVLNNHGRLEIKVIDANQYENNQYKNLILVVIPDIIKHSV